jgi:hypothetical protein
MPRGPRGRHNHAPPISSTLSLTLADSGGVSECIFHALPDMARNFYTVSARPGHEINLSVTIENNPSRSGVVRRIALSDHWRWVSTPR